MFSKRSVKAEDPQAVFSGGDFEYRVLKTYQNDDAKPFARWFLATRSPFTYGSFELGDGYVRDVVLHASLVEVDGRIPTADELTSINDLRGVLRAAKDPMDSIFG